MNNKVILTGITGFIGYNIAQFFLENTNYEIYALIRESSNMERCEDILGHKNLHCFKLQDWEANQTPNIHTLIHCAWAGVSAQERDSWEKQSENVVFTTKLLQIAKNRGVKKVIALGSQAEYGHFAGRINESYTCKPTTAYGAAKLATLEMLRHFCELNKIEWYWLRLFSIFGEKEDKNWFMSYVIHELINGRDLNLTLCEQKYDYLYVKELARAIDTIMNASTKAVGVYNLSSDQSIALKDIVSLVKSRIHSKSMLHFGAMPYRQGQIMHMEGDSSKFNKTFDFYSRDFEQNLFNLIEFIKNDKSKTFSR